MADRYSFVSKSLAVKAVALTAFVFALALAGTLILPGSPVPPAAIGAVMPGGIVGPGSTPEIIDIDLDNIESVAGAPPVSPPEQEDEN